MTGVDANVLLRFYIEDKSDREAIRQRLAAAKLFAEEPLLYVPKTVLLECEWVMRAVYGYAVAQVAAVFHHLLELKQVRVEDAETVGRALQAYDKGLDFADAMHLASCAACESFATFDDRQFSRRAIKLGLTPICRVPAA